MANLKELYNKRILTLNKTPYHFEKVDKFDLVIEANNPICGDRFLIYLTLRDSAIASAHFHGFGCALSKASTSILVKELEGMELSDAKSHAESFLSKLKDGEHAEHDDLNLLLVLSSHGARLDCIKLSWEALKDLKS